MYCDSTSWVEDILVFAHALDEKYAEQKESIRRLQFSGHVGLLADEMAMVLIPEELPLQPGEHLVAVKTTLNGDCLFNTMSLVMDGTESNTSLLPLLMALELLLNMDFYIQHPRLTSFSNTDSHHPDTLFSLCLTTNSDQVFHDKSCSREEAILSEAHVASKSYEWSGFFSFNAEENGMICDLCCAYPSAAGNTEFLKGCSNFQKETIRKHAISNGHIRARDRSLSKEKLIAESQIAQSFSKINKDMQSQERKEMEAKINTAYFVTLRGYGCCREKMESH